MPEPEHRHTDKPANATQKGPRQPGIETKTSLLEGDRANHHTAAPASHDGWQFWTYHLSLWEMSSVQSFVLLFLWKCHPVLRKLLHPSTVLHPSPLPLLPSPHLFSYSSHLPLAPISECGTMSYGMALRCAKTAEVMDTDRTYTASCDACKWAGYSWLGSWEPGAKRCTISSAPPSRTAPGQVDPTNEPSSMWDSSQHLEKDRDPSDNALRLLPLRPPSAVSPLSFTLGRAEHAARQHRLYVWA